MSEAARGQSIPPTAEQRIVSRDAVLRKDTVMLKLERHHASIVALSNEIYDLTRGVFNDAPAWLLFPAAFC